MSAKHTTPGPWFFNPADEWRTASGEHVQFGRFNISASSTDPNAGHYYHVGSVSNANNSGQNQANARLIAAAPDLLSVAVRFESWLTEVESAEVIAGSRTVNSQWLADLRAAISKATGAAA